VSDEALAEAFEAAAPAATCPPRAELERSLAALVDTARAAHPSLPVDAPAFVAAIARHAGEGADVPDLLAHCHAGDLHLAAAVLAGAPGAVARLEEIFGGVLDAIAHRYARLHYSADDVRQIVVERLLVGDGERGPKLADYAGQGFLENWLRVTAVRICLDLEKRKDRPREGPASDETVLALPAAADLELDAIKREYREQVSSALHAAARALDAGDRHLLRQHLVGGMTIDQLAVVYGIHRATAARRVSRAREQLISATRASIIESLGLATGELDEVMELVASRIDLSLTALLATQR
jgi:RNA polymerase sigma-70 factor (ECF subfamily)